MYGMKVLLRDGNGAIKSWFAKFSPTVWVPGEWREAVCFCNCTPSGRKHAFCLPHDHPPCQPIVEFHAGCGFHAATVLYAFRGFVYGMLAPYVTRGAVVYALVEGGGEIAVHEEGFRSQYMRVVEIFNTLEDLKQAYNEIKEAQNEKRKADDRSTGGHLYSKV